MKKARTPEEAWGMWVERHYGDELIADQQMREQLDMLCWETEQWLSSYFASRTPVAAGGQAGGGGGGGGRGGGRPPAAAGGSGGSPTPSGSGTPTRPGTTPQDTATLRSSVEAETQTRRTSTPTREDTPTATRQDTSTAPSTTETADTAAGSTRRGTPESSSTRESATDANQTPAVTRTPSRILNEAHYDVVPILVGINEGKLRLTHKTNGRSYLFKPASGEQAMEFGPDIGIQTGERYRRAPADAAVGRELGIAAPGTEIVVFRGEIGSLQEWVTGHSTLAELGQTNRALYDRIRQSQQFRDLDTFDYLIANMDRHSGNVLVDVRPDGSFRLIPIDTDAVFPPSAVRFAVSPAQIPSVEAWQRMYGNPMSRDLYLRLTHMAQNRAQLRRALAVFLSDAEINGMLARLDEILDGVHAGRIRVQ